MHDQAPSELLLTLQKNSSSSVQSRPRRRHLNRFNLLLEKESVAFLARKAFLGEDVYAELYVSSLSFSIDLWKIGKEKGTLMTRRCGSNRSRRGGVAKPRTTSCLPSLPSPPSLPLPSSTSLPLTFTMGASEYVYLRESLILLSVAYERGKQKRKNELADLRSFLLLDLSFLLLPISSLHPPR